MRNSLGVFGIFALCALIVSVGCQEEASTKADGIPSSVDEALRQREQQLAKVEHDLKEWADRLHARESALPPTLSPPTSPQFIQPRLSPTLSTQALPFRKTVLPRSALSVRPEELPVGEGGVATNLDTVREISAEPEPPADRDLLPQKRPRREIRATTASYGGPAKLLGDKLMMRAMQNPQRIPAGKFYECNFEAFLDAKALAPGQRFSIGVDTRGQANFGPAQEAGGFSEEQWFEAQVLAVRQAAPNNPKDRGGVVFQVNYLVMPHPDGNPNHEMAIPVKAVVVSERRDDRPDFRSREQDNERLWSAVGQMTGGVEGYFNAGAASVLLSKLNNIYIGKDQSSQCYFMGQVKKQTPCYVRIDQDAVF